MVQIQPAAGHPLPFDLTDEQPKTVADSVAIAVNTVDLISELGGFRGEEGEGSADYTDDEFHQAVGLAQSLNNIAPNLNSVKPQQVPKTVSQSGIAKVLSIAVKEHDFRVFEDAQQARNFVTSKLVKIADCGDLKLELKALELLGKHSDIGLFTERSEITVHHTTSQGLENSIKERIKRLLNTSDADIVDITPLDDLDAQLGFPEEKDNGGTT